MANKFDRVAYDKYKELRQLTTGLLRVALVSRGAARELIQNTSVSISDFSASEQEAYAMIDNYLTNNDL